MCSNVYNINTDHFELFSCRHVMECPHVVYGEDKLHVGSCEYIQQTFADSRHGVLDLGR
jgi:hypothetical protein